MPIASYPRFGQLLAPETLRSVLEVPVPGPVAKRFSRIKWRGVQLADLDAASWERFGEKACKALGEAIVEQVKEAIKSSSAPIHRQRLPRTNTAMPLYALSVGSRAYNCLARAGFRDDVRRLGELTAGDLMKLRNFGVKSLVDVLAALESVPNVRGPLLPRPAPSEGAWSWIEWARADDLLLPPYACEWTFPALPATMTVEELNLSPGMLRGLRELGLGKSLSSWSGYPILRLLEPFGVGVFRFHSLLRRLDAVLHPSPQTPAADLETELLDVFLAHSRMRETLATRNRRMFSRFYGLDGQGGATLTTIGRAEGLPRQGVWHVCQLRPRPGCATPRLDSVLQTVAELAPAPAADVEAELFRRGLLSRPVPMTALVQFARALRHPLPVQIIPCGDHRKPWVVCLDAPSKLLVYLKRTACWHIEHFGAACLADIAARVATLTAEPVDPALAKSFLGTLPDFCWLDETSGWFWLRNSSENVLLRQVRKILAVAGRLTVDALIDCICRLRLRCKHLPLQRFNTLPPHVLSNFCRGVPGARLEGDDLVADPSLDWRVVLPPIQREIVGIFVEHGPLLHGKDLKNHAIQRGINYHTLHMTLSRLPMIRRRPDGYYDLYAARAQPAVSDNVRDALQARPSADKARKPAP